MPSNVDFINDLLLKKTQQAQQQPVVPAISPTPTFAGQGPALPAIAPPTEIPPPVEVDGTGSMPVIEPTRERVVAQPPPITPGPAQPALPVIAPGREMERELADLDAKDYSIKKDEAGNITHRGKDRDKKWSIWDKIGSALVGWAQGGLAGGIKAGTDRNYFEKMGDSFQRDRLLPKIAAQQQIEGNQVNTENKRLAPIIERQKIERQAQNDLMRYTTQITLAEAKARQEGNKWVPFTDPGTGIVMKQYRNRADGETEPLLDSQGNKIKDPSKQLYDWVDPTSGQTVKITGAQLAGAGAQIATGNATRTQQAATTNANNSIEVAKENNRRITQWQKNNLDTAMDAVRQAGTAMANAGEVQGFATEMQSVNEQIAQSIDPTETVKLQSKYGELEGKFKAALGKTEAGLTVSQALQGSMMPKPDIMTAPSVKPSIIKPGKPVAKSRDPLGLFQ